MDVAVIGDGQPLRVWWCSKIQWHQGGYQSRRWGGQWSESEADLHVPYLCVTMHTCTHACMPPWMHRILGTEDAPHADSQLDKHIIHRAWGFLHLCLQVKALSWWSCNCHGPPLLVSAKTDRLLLNLLARRQIVTLPIPISLLMPPTPWATLPVFWCNFQSLLWQLPSGLMPLIVNPYVPNLTYSCQRMAFSSHQIICCFWCCGHHWTHQMCSLSWQRWHCSHHRGKAAYLPLSSWWGQ